MPGRTRSYVGVNDYAAGDAVVYRNNSTTGEPVGGLVDGTTYYVANPTATTTQLADVKGNVIPLTPTANPAACLLERPPVGGLVSGRTYYAVNTTATSFQLAATPGGTP